MASSRSRWSVLAVVCLLSGCAGTAAGRQSHAPAVQTAYAPQRLLTLTRYVNPFVGTAGQGNTFPGATVPHGMMQWSAETTSGGLFRPGGYNSGDLIARGFGLTHLSGAGCVAFENFPFMPTVRPMTAAPQPNGSPYSDRFVVRTEHASPGYYSVRLASGIGIELSATTRTGFGRFTFPPARRATILIDAGNSAGARSNIDGADASSIEIEGRDEIAGWARSGHFCGLPNSYTVYFAARFDRPFAAGGVWNGARLLRGQQGSAGRHVGGFVQFDTARGRTVQVEVGLSYVSIAGAQRNLAAESRDWRFVRVRQAAAASWNGLLNRIQVSGGTAVQRRTLYTALYHTFLGPTVFSDADGSYRGFDGRVHRVHGSVMYANFSGWDIYRSQIPLLAWLEPRAASDMMQSLVTDARQGGRLPKWPVANAYTGEMDGDSADPILAGAAAFGATGFDRRAALRAMIAGATRPGPGPQGYLERPQLADYLRAGYVSPVTGGWGSAAETLEYATDDFAIARMAAMLGNRPAAARFLARSHTWRRLFDPATGFLEPRASDGSFPAGFEPASTSGFVEGNAWQYLWMVPHDLPALAHLLGGPGNAVARLGRLFRKLNAGPTSPYYWAGNEPGLGIPWEFDFFGRPDRTRSVVRTIVSRLYSDSRAGLPGNDDLGTLSSWYVWAVLGLYPEIPGVGGFALAAPLFPAATIQYGEGRTLHFLAGAARSGSTSPRLSLHGTALTRAWLPRSPLRPQSTLRYRLSR